MKNKFKIILYFTLCFNIVSFTYVKSNEQFNFDVTEIEITNEGNYYKGLKKHALSVFSIFFSEIVPRFQKCLSRNPSCSIRSPKMQIT